MNPAEPLKELTAEAITSRLLYLLLEDGMSQDRAVATVRDLGRIGKLHFS
jgi:hypothetical protein